MPRIYYMWRSTSDIKRSTTPCSFLQLEKLASAITKIDSLLEEIDSDSTIIYVMKTAGEFLQRKNSDRDLTEPACQYLIHSAATINLA